MPTFMTILWAVILVALVIVEAATVQLVTIWFAVGAFAALIAAVFGASVTLQIILFVAVSLTALIITRPIVKKRINQQSQPLNADRNIGQIAVVTEEIDNIKATGKARINGMDWTARSENEEIIFPGKNVEIVKIEGVKLIVKEIKED